MIITSDCPGREPGRTSRKDGVGMKRVVLVGLVLILVIAALAGCAKGEPADQGQEDETKVPVSGPETPGTEPGGAGPTGSVEGEDQVVEGSVASKAFEDFKWDKELMIWGIYEGIDSLQDKLENSNVYLKTMLSIEMSLEGQDVALGNLDPSKWAEYQDINEKDVSFKREGNKNVLTYKKSDTSPESTTTAEFVDGGRWIIITYHNPEAPIEIYLEFLETSYGYAVQYYCPDLFQEQLGLDTNHVLISIDDKKDGVIGFATSPGFPARLTGNESLDFPKVAPEWYSRAELDWEARSADGEEYSYSYPSS